MGSINPFNTSPIFAPPTLVPAPACLTPLAFAATLSSSVKNLAFSGLSGKKNHATNAIATLGKPSTKNNTLHFAIPGFPLVIPYASAPANVFASGAAEKNIPILNPNSLLR